ncbi:MAG: DUF1826 domain-containing protein [Pseudomonadota bacterium]
MNVARNIAENVAIGVCQGLGVADDAATLSGFRNQGCAAAILRRVNPPAFQSWIDALAPDRLPKGRKVVGQRDVRRTALQFCLDSNTPEGPERALLIDDVATLADRFADIMKAAYLRVRFDVIETNACRKFHVDAITGRLVCTYRGTGTQYGISTGGGDPEQVHTTPTGAPILLRGTRWPERPGTGFLHRSPPIAGTGETRLVLVLDPMDALEEEY